MPDTHRRRAHLSCQCRRAGGRKLETTEARACREPLSQLLLPRRGSSQARSSRSGGLMGRLTPREAYPVGGGESMVPE
jgi:hypothetical protein